MEKKLSDKFFGSIVTEKKKVKFPDVVTSMIDTIKPEEVKKPKVPLTRVRLRSLLEEAHLNFSNFFYQNAYIVTNISMMIWSIVYHSWLGFVLLIWSNMIWIKSNKRGTMMKSSPFLVIYAICLLIINYIYGMNFSNDELPSALSGVNLQQIGLIKYERNAGIHLLLKSLFTFPFWFTMRLMFQEKMIMEHRKTLKFDAMIQKLTQENKEKSNMTIFIIKKFSMFSLMWIIVFSLFITAVIGEKMTLLRIVNMCFFLVFVLLLQFHFKAWIKVMETFWYTVIIYLMCALIATYAYQFDNFPAFLYQSEIGLEKYPIKKLGLKLFSFTAIIILTGLQMNHFHENFKNLFHFAPGTSQLVAGNDDEESSNSENPSTVKL